MSNNPHINAALFQFCQMADDGPRQNSDHKPIPKRSAEELQWLKAALESVEAPERTVKRLLETILKDELSDQDILDALEELSDTVEDLNWALEFTLMNGHMIIIRLLESTRAKNNASIRRSASMVIAHAAQQNKPVQTAFNQIKWADVLLPVLRSEDDLGALAAHLHACSCMCRECDEGSASFLAAGGVAVLTKLLSTENADKINAKIAQRILFLVSYFAHVGVSSEALIENTCFQVCLSSSEEISKSASQTVFSLVKKCPRLVRSVAEKIALPYLEGLNGLDKDDPRRQLLDILKAEPSSVVTTTAADAAPPSATNAAQSSSPTTTGSGGALLLH